ncbi:MAG: hypothetical protein ACLU8S_02745 [Coprococcus phoceensis]
MNNNLDYQFGMYAPATDSIIINTGENSVLIIRCKECNSSVTLIRPERCCVSLPAGKGNTSAVCRVCNEGKWIAGLCGCYE